MGRGPGSLPLDCQPASPNLTPGLQFCEGAGPAQAGCSEADGGIGGAGAQAPHVESFPLPASPPKPRRQLPLLPSRSAIILLDCSFIRPITGRCGDRVVCTGPWPAVQVVGRTGHTCGQPHGETYCSSPGPASVGGPAASPPPHPPRLMASLVTQLLLLQAQQGE